MVEESVLGKRHPGGVGGAPAVAVMFVCVAVLLAGTGLTTDDYVHLLNGLTRRLADNLLPREYVSVPLLHYTHGLAYYLIGDRLWAYDALKAVYAALGVFFTARFFGCFMPPRRALVFGFLFIFLPFHDAAAFSLTNQYLVISFTGLLYAFALGAEGRYRLAVAFALAGSFASYGSPPIAFGLAVLALMLGRGRLAAAILVPNLIYVAYYLVASLYLRVGTQRLTGEFNVAALGKQLILQLATFGDATLGPSGLSKLHYSIASLDVATMLSALVVAGLALHWLASESSAPASRRLPVVAGLILLGAFAMFALTGLYPQLAFGLGDRVMIYGDFFLVCLLASQRLPRLLIAVVVTVLFLAIAGLATHWKAWYDKTERVAAAVRGNEALRRLPPGTKLFVAGHQYSRLGPYCHVEFFTADYVVQTVFKLNFGVEPELQLRSFNRRLEFQDGVLQDRKYGERHAITEGIWIYDTERDVLEWVVAGAISTRLQHLPDETRHWTQRLGDGWLKDRLLSAVPRLRYAY